MCCVIKGTFTDRGLGTHGQGAACEMCPNAGNKPRAATLKRSPGLKTRVQAGAGECFEAATVRGATVSGMRACICFNMGRIAYKSQ